jgi:hypothetical protein
VFTKVVRLKRYGRKRLVIVHEQPDLSDVPPIFSHRCVALGKWTSNSDLELRSRFRGLS